MVYIACNYQALKNQISRIMKLEKSIFRQSKSLTSSQADISPLKNDAIDSLLLFLNIV